MLGSLLSHPFPLPGPSLSSVLCEESIWETCFLENSATYKFSIFSSQHRKSLQYTQHHDTNTTIGSWWPYLPGCSPNGQQTSTKATRISCFQRTTPPFSFWESPSFGAAQAHILRLENTTVLILQLTWGDWNTLRHSLFFFFFKERQALAKDTFPTKQKRKITWELQSVFLLLGIWWIKQPTDGLAFLASGSYRTLYFCCSSNLKVYLGVLTLSTSLH